MTIDPLKSEVEPPHIYLHREDPGMWVFQYPRLESGTYDELHKAIELWESGHIEEAERGYRSLIAEFPEFIDAYHHLALLLDGEGSHDEAFDLWNRAVSIGLSAMPAEFDLGADSIPWSHLDNRPFLRAYHALAIGHARGREYDRALEMALDLLSLNPNDNLGARALAINYAFEARRPDMVLEVCESYPDDFLAYVPYGRVLALFQMGRTGEAQKDLALAVRELPLIALELVKKRHRRPKGMREGYVAIRTQEEAYSYWQDQGVHWQRTYGALQFVEEYLSALRGDDRW